MKTLGVRNSRIWTLSALAAMTLFASACKEPNTIAPTYTDRFKNDTYENYTTANAILRGDYLLVLDYSYSMNSKVSELTDSLQGFADDLRNKDIDYRIGVVRGNFHGTASTNAEVKAWTPDNFIAKFIDIGKNNILDSVLLDQVSQVGGELQQNRTVLLEAARRTLTARKNTFLRDEAQLIVVFVSDSDDESNNYTTAYGHDTSVAAYASNLKSYKLPGYTNARAIVAGYGGCPTKYSYDKAGTRLWQTAHQVDGSSPSCLYDTFTESLGDLAQNVTKPTNKFKLQSTPLGNVTVRVDGIDVPSAGNWNYKASTNEIIFVAGQEPGPAQQVELFYEIAFKLKQKPIVSTITVTVNGSTVPQSNSNGWSYLASENRIVFNGAAVPADGADVRVTYER